LPIFEVALDHIKQAVAKDLVIDMYSGVGSIGLCIGDTVTALIEIDESNIAYTKQNVNNRNIEIVHASSEEAIDYITDKNTIVVDPPRAGLHKDVIARIVETKPKKVVYLSCNPSTQARDIAIMSSADYKITRAEGYNFFPRTPHIESLIVLELSPQSSHTRG
jgi:23S rRNA (uracil1939-C5)-methyltransferase